MEKMKQPSNNRLTFIVFAALAAVGLYVGWRAFWFLTDDAYIAFRYISNSYLGYGYVWNAPPFLPVEGYTSFLWIVVLDGFWRITGIEPPASANYVSLFFAYLTVLLAGKMTWSLVRSEANKTARVLFLFVVLLGLLLNRVFLTWSSSGLETGMFNFFVLLWLYFAVQVSPNKAVWLWELSSSAVLIALTRPDGLLYCAFTIVIAFTVWLVYGSSRYLRRLWGLCPLVIVILHLLWRHSFYGDWLPNTYYAKMSGMWPESGIRYLASFVLEHALWIWLVVLLCAFFAVSAGKRKNSPDPNQPVLIMDLISRWGGIAALIAHAGYYTFIVGGDHFEYRVYSHLVVPILLSFVWALNALKIRQGISVSILIGFILISSIIPWTHWSASKEFGTRDDTHQLRVKIADRFPAPLRFYVRYFDDLQDWLITHYVCSRHQEHKIAIEEWMNSTLPTREEGSKISAERYPVMAFWGGIGGLSWVLPHVYFIDLFGLNDYVIARSKKADEVSKKMAHDRRPPAGYVECFIPNVNLAPRRKITVTKRPKTLTEEKIITSEKRWRQRLKEQNR